MLRVRLGGPPQEQMRLTLNRFFYFGTNPGGEDPLTPEQVHIFLR
jgi:hypothetical protein